MKNNKMKDEKTFFHSRQNSNIHHAEIKQNLQVKSAELGVSESFQNEVQLMSVRVGLDTPPFFMEKDDIADLGDLFSKEILLKNKYPSTLNQLVKSIEEIEGYSKANRRMFLVAEGGQFKIEHPDFTLNARLVFTWQKSNTSPPDFLLSTIPATNNNKSLLQLIAWSPSDNSFHFFERINNVWGWAGNSFTALTTPTRGKGPFDSHINGGLVMKELKFPWAHWHSQSNSIPREVFEADSEFNTDSLFSKIDGAEQLENIVKNGIRRWTKSRLSNDINSSALQNLISYFNQVITPTSANLISSSLNFDEVQNNELKLPSSFFFDIDAIEMAALEIDPTIDVVPSDNITVEGKLYKKTCDALNMKVLSQNGSTQFNGDTHFCFLVPERAFEDLEVCRQLVEQKVISPKMLLCLIMIDFTNPLESKSREKILDYCPEKIDGFEKNYELDSILIEKINSAEQPENTPEAVLLKYWNSSDLLNLVKSELSTFIMGIQNQVNNENYLNDLVVLAEYRKTLFRKRDLNEFLSTTSQLGINPSEHSFDKNGSIIKL